MIRSAVPFPREANFTKPFTWRVMHFYDHIRIEVICIEPNREGAYIGHAIVPVLDFVHNPVSTRDKLARTLRTLRAHCKEQAMKPVLATLALEGIMATVREES